jgi:hypothetical protein
MNGRADRVRVLRAVAVLAAAWTGAATVRGQDVAPIMKGVRAPLDFHPDGKPKAVLYADLARVPPEGDVTAEGVRVEFLDANGQVEATARTEMATFSRQSKRVVSDSRVAVEKGGVAISGKGWDWSADDKAVKIRKDVKVVIRNESAQASGGLLGPIERLRQERRKQSAPGEAAQPAG